MLKFFLHIFEYSLLLATEALARRGRPGPLTSSVAPGSPRTCQVQHGPGPTALSPAWAAVCAALYRCKGVESKEEERRSMEGGQWETLNATWESSGLHTTLSAKNTSTHSCQNYTRKKYHVSAHQIVKKSAQHNCLSMAFIVNYFPIIEISVEKERKLDTCKAAGIIPFHHYNVWFREQTNDATV